ncbi:MAG: hypothetical protein ING09_17965 [Roseomonas sp.]|nr:hypothetical protein [Roseomonas sp.]
MTEIKAIPKGFALEEVLRAYFLRAGFFVVRGVPLRIEDEVITDVDLWLYDKPTGTSRRIQLCDIKYKQKPKAVERILWTSGLTEALGVDGAYVATTDSRPALRVIASRLNLQLIDGVDIKRIQSSTTILYPDRIYDEQLIAELQFIDKDLRIKEFQSSRLDILSSLTEGFGAPSTVRSLEAFSRLAGAVVSHHPNSKPAKAAGRLAFLAGALCCMSLDYVSVGAAFRSVDERRKLILDAVRLGALGEVKGQKALKTAIALIEKYAPGGKKAARMIETSFKNDVEQIPAEIIADQAVRLLKENQLFVCGRELESACYATELSSFDNLSAPTKSMLGALLDYSQIDRQKFAQAWTAVAPQPMSVMPSGANEEGTPSLFDVE